MNRTGLNRYTPLKRTAMATKRIDTGPSRAVVALVKARSGGRCEFPGCTKRAIERHHRYERGMGGTSLEWVNWPSNLLDSCHYHNQWASNGEPTAAREMGWLLKHLDRPLQVPVQTRHDEDPVWLDNQGGWWPFDEGIP